MFEVIGAVIHSSMPVSTTIILTFRLGQRTHIWQSTEWGSQKGLDKYWIYRNPLLHGYIITYFCTLSGYVICCWDTSLLPVLLSKVDGIKAILALPGAMEWQPLLLQLLEEDNPALQYTGERTCISSPPPPSVLQTSPELILLHLLANESDTRDHPSRRDISWGCQLCLYNYNQESNLLQPGHPDWSWNVACMEVVLPRWLNLNSRSEVQWYEGTMNLSLLGRPTNRWIYRFMQAWT
jgi:hypothetical protein